MSFREWKLNEQSGAAKIIADGCGLGGLVSRVLAGRGYLSAQQVNNLLLGDAQMESPFAIKDMDRAVERIRKALADGEVIAIFGDYDVDGITASALMFSYLSSVCENEVIVRLPERKTEGYGLSKTAINELACRGVSLIVTVDNGISAFDEVDFANELGIDVVICDHHISRDRVPNAIAVVDPNRGDCKSRFKGLAGVGVALKLAAAVEDCSPEQMVDFFGYYAALGTVADVVPLVSENRFIVKSGLEQIRQEANAGITALLEAASISPDTVDARSIAFGIAPRLNAAGRIGSPKDSFDLLVDEDRSAELAELINNLNTERKQLELEVENQIAGIFTAEPEILNNPVIVVGDVGFSGGVIGIVASRLTERYGKPAIVYIDNGEILKGSCRSVENFNLYDALSYSSEYLERFGGHRMAAGLSLKKENLAAFCNKLAEYCAVNPVPHGITHIDCIVAPEELTVEQIESLSLLEPFGNQNEQPVFVMRGAVIEEILPLAERFTSYRVTYRNASYKVSDFSRRVKDCPYYVGEKIDIAFNASTNEFNGKKYLSLKAVDFRAYGFLNSQLDEVDLFNRMCLMPSWDKAFSGLLPSREDIAVVYRLLLKQRYNESDLSPIIVDSGLSAGKALTALRVLQDVDLISQKGLKPIKTAEKLKLESSKIYSYLLAGGN